MNVASEKKEDKKLQDKRKGKNDMEDTKNYLLKHSHNNTCQDAESLLQKQNPYGLKFKNISSTRKPNISYVTLSKSRECLKRKTIDDVEFATNIQKKKSITASYCSMKKTNKCTKYQTDIHEKKTKTMKSSTTNKNNALLNKTSQINQVTDCIVSTTSTQTIINVDHPLVKLGYVIFEMSGDLKIITSM